MHIFEKRTIVIATMHGKEHVIAPEITQSLNVVCIVANGINTDGFGTFTRDIKRPGDMLTTAHAKIQKAMDISGCDIAIASEGSFGVHPSVPFAISNIELTVLYDRIHNIEIKGHHRTGETNCDGKYISSIDAALRFAYDHGFPEHGIIVRRWKEGKRCIDKNIATEKDLIHSVERMLHLPFTNKIYIETDMRAHKNPTRMKAIRYSIQNLIHNATQMCPQCNMPGYIVKEKTGHLLCGGCAQATDIPLYNVLRCDVCGHTEHKKIAHHDTFADPACCNYCNP